MSLRSCGLRVRRFMEYHVSPERGRPPATAQPRSDGCHRHQRRIRRLAMSLKTILVPTEPHDAMTATLETALLLARRFDSYMEGFALRPAIDNFVAMDPISGMAMATVKQRDAETATQAQSIFESFMQ